MIRSRVGIPIRLPGARPLLLMSGLVLATGMLAACGNGEDDVDAVDPAPEPRETPGSADSTSSPDPTSTPEPRVDIETIAEEAGCDITPAIGVNDPWLTEVSPAWMRFGDLSIARSGPGPFQLHDATWHTGHERVVWHVPSEHEIDESIQITGHNMDTEAQLAPTSVAMTYQVPDGEIAFATVEFPEEGCWQVLIGDAEVVAYVLPEEERPDVRAMIKYRQEVLPYEVPATCDFTEWSGPSTHEGLFAAYMLPNAEVDVMSWTAVFFAGENNLFVVTEDPDTIVSGQSKVNPAMTLRSEVQRASGGVVPLVEAKLDFPVSGCWDLRFEADGEATDATLYVYPEECRREPGEDLSEDCIVPD